MCVFLASCRRGMIENSTDSVTLQKECHLKLDNKNICLNIVRVLLRHP
jgi:hypothetical protein